MFGQKQEEEEPDYEKEAEVKQKRSDIARSLLAGELEEETVTVEVTEQQPSLYDAFKVGNGTNGCKYARRTFFSYA